MSLRHAQVVQRASKSLLQCPPPASPRSPVAPVRSTTPLQKGAPRKLQYLRLRTNISCSPSCLSCTGPGENDCLGCVIPRGGLAGTCVAVDPKTGVCDGKDLKLGRGYVRDNNDGRCKSESMLEHANPSLPCRLQWMSDCRVLASRDARQPRVHIVPRWLHDEEPHLCP